jgi:hypothetical protein
MQRASRARRIQPAAILKQGDELAKAFVELPHQEAVEADAVLEQPEEGAAVHRRQASVAQGHHVVAAGLVLEHGTLAEPCPAVRPAKLAALPPRDTMPILAKPETTPVQYCLPLGHRDIAPQQ